MKDLEQYIPQVLAHVDETIGEREQWVKWPGGWRDDIESALVDAVFSARAVYRSAHGRGISSQLERWQAARDRSTYSLAALTAEIGAAGVTTWAKRFGNCQVSPGRPDTAPYGRSKAATVLDAAQALRHAGINVARQIGVDNAAQVKQTLMSVEGVGYATSNYFLMLLGAPGVKPDRMIHRFLQCATRQAFTNADAEQLIELVARRIAVPAHELDHAIWAYESNRACPCVNPVA